MTWSASSAGACRPVPCRGWWQARSARPQARQRSRVRATSRLLKVRRLITSLSRARKAHRLRTSRWWRSSRAVSGGGRRGAPPPSIPERRPLWRDAVHSRSRSVSVRTRSARSGNANKRRRLRRLLSAATRRPRLEFQSSLTRGKPRSAYRLRQRSSPTSPGEDPEVRLVRN